MAYNVGDMHPNTFLINLLNYLTPLCWPPPITHVGACLMQSSPVKKQSKMAGYLAA